MSDARIIDNYLRVSEAAYELGISRATLLKLCRDQKIAHIQMCNRYLFRRDDLAAFIEARRLEIVPSFTPQPYQLKHIKKSALREPS